MKYCPDGDVRHYLKINAAADRLKLVSESEVYLTVYETHLMLF